MLSERFIHPLQARSACLVPICIWVYLWPKYITFGPYVSTGVVAIEYLIAAPEPPLVIICDVNMPAMNGLERRQLIELNEYLKLKCIPFVFSTTAADQGLINTAYRMTIQGYFKKERTFAGLQEQMRSIPAYLDKCSHPNSRFD